MLILDRTPEQQKTHKRFHFDNRRVNALGFEELIANTLRIPHRGHPMYQVSQKIKNCRLEFLEWKMNHSTNSAYEIKKLKQKMETLQNQGGDRDWSEWQRLKKKLI